MLTRLASVATLFTVYVMAVGALTAAVKLIVCCYDNRSDV